VAAAVVLVGAANDQRIAGQLEPLLGDQVDGVGESALAVEVVAIDPDGVRVASVRD
jgi:hypothetical protein